MQHYLQTPRLILRDWSTSDNEPFAQMNADPVVMEHYPYLMSREQSDAFVERIKTHLQERGYGLYAVEEKASGDFLGYVGMQYVNFAESFTPCNEIGWRLRKECWNQGYATEAAIACLKHAFDDLGFEEVHSFTSFFNLPSQRVMQKIGMSPIGSFEHPKVSEDSHLRMHALYRILKQDFAPA